MGYLGATLTQVFTCAGGADVSLRDVTIAQMGNRATENGWRHAPEARGEFWKFWKSQLVESRTGHRTRRVDFRQNRKNVYLSSYVETFNSKVIKGSVPELRSRYVFSCFGIPMFYVYMLRTLWTFCVPVWKRPFHVFISGYVAQPFC